MARLRVSTVERLGAWLGLVVVLAIGTGCSYLSSRLTYRLEYRERAPDEFRTVYLDPTGSGEWLTTVDQAQGQQGFLVATPETGDKRTLPLADVCRVERLKNGNTVGMHVGMFMAMPGAFGLVYGAIAMGYDGTRHKLGNAGWAVLGASAGLLVAGVVTTLVSRKVRTATTIYDGQCRGAK
jgi:hypothetical protein